MRVRLSLIPLDMEKDKRDEFINKAIALGEATKRECMVCKTEFVGLRNVCSDKCNLALQKYVAYNRSLRPIDYCSSGRKVFLVTELPEDLPE